MEAQIFTPDSKRFVLHRSAHSHGSDQSDPEHRYLLCDLENAGALSPLTDETGATAPSVSPDGTWMYYFVNETGVNAGRLTLKRVRLDGTARETLTVIDAPLPGTGGIPSHIYPLSTISSTAGVGPCRPFSATGNRGAPFGLIFDLEQAAVSVVLTGPTTNMHPQYAAPPPLMTSSSGKSRQRIRQRRQCIRLVGGEGADIHLIATTVRFSQPPVGPRRK